MKVKDILKNRNAKEKISNEEELEQWLLTNWYHPDSLSRMNTAFDDSSEHYMKSSLPANGLGKRVAYDFLEEYGFFEEVNLTMNQDEACQYVYDWWVTNNNAY